MGKVSDKNRGSVCNILKEKKTRGFVGRMYRKLFLIPSMANRLKEQYDAN